MNKHLKATLIGGLLAIGLASAVWAAGLFPGLPAATSPLTGTECIPADTNLSGGRTPQTECITPLQLYSFAGSPVTLVDAATVSWNAGAANVFYLTLGGNRNLDTPTGAANGQEIILVVTEDATGGRSLTFNSGWKFGAGSTPSFQTTGANAISMMRAIYNGTYWLAGSPVYRLQ